MVSALLEMQGIPVYAADTESKRLTNSSPWIRSRLIALLGESVYMGDEIDRKRLADYIFTNPERLKQVNAIIHPEVKRHFLAWVAGQTATACAIESAILFESGFNQVVDISVMVYAPLEQRIERAMARDGATRDEIIRRINNQLPDEIKKRHAAYLIYNDERHALIPQVSALLATLRETPCKEDGSYSWRR
jgi:dephospho-CoA kinase